MKFNVNSSMSVGGNSISFYFQKKQKWNMVIQANEKIQVKSVDISLIYIKTISFGFRAIKSSFHFHLNYVKTYSSLISSHYPFWVIVIN